MKLIDLLNKIANGEEVPKKIKFQNVIYEYDRNKKEYIHEIKKFCAETLLFNVMCCHYINEILEAEVEVIEDEEIDIQEIDTTTLSNRKLLEVIVRVVKQIDKKLKEKE